MCPCIWPKFLNFSPLHIFIGLTLLSAFRSHMVLLYLCIFFQFLFSTIFCCDRKLETATHLTDALTTELPCCGHFPCHINGRTKDDEKVVVTSLHLYLQFALG